MRTLLFMLLASLATLALGPGCDDTVHSTFYDLGNQSFKHTGDPCQPDTPTTSECGYAPQFYCTAQGICASACNTSSDCLDGSMCVGSGDMVAGECRLTATLADGGAD